MQAFVDSAKYAGAVMVIARHGKIGYMESIGYMDKENKVSMNSDAVFRIRSMTKPLIAAAILKLLDQGKILLENPASNYIPALTDYSVKGNDGDFKFADHTTDPQKTVKDLLVHTSGLPLHGATEFKIIINE